MGGKIRSAAMLPLAAWTARALRASPLHLRARCVVARAVTSGGELPSDEAGWRTILSPNQFAVLREKATEPPGYSEMREGELEFELKQAYETKYPSEGVYECVGCGAPLYYARTKFDSGCGWPAFYDGIPGAIAEVPDADGSRTEIVCANCGGHLGHVFKNEGFPSPTDARHCVNGIALRYEPAAPQPDDVIAMPNFTPGSKV